MKLAPKAYRHKGDVCYKTLLFMVDNEITESPRIRGGLKNLRVLKTTQSSFTDFIQDDYRTLPDANDRIFSTVVTASWDFSTASGVDFDRVWQVVKDCILENFAGPAETGIYSPSVQNTLYLAEKCVLIKVNQVIITCKAFVPI